MELTLSHEDAAFRDEILQDTKAVRHRGRLVPGAEHRMVDMFIAHEEALSLMQHLTLSLAANEAGLSRLASSAKSKIGHAGKFLADQAVQLRGGIGMTDELSVGHYFKRISSINIQFGDPAYHVMRYAQLDAAA